jgi:hypothetical protein
MILLFLFHFPRSDIQFSTGLQQPLPVWLANELPSLLFALTVFLNDTNIATLPVYHLTPASDHRDAVLTLKFYRRIERFCFESLPTDQMKKPIQERNVYHEEPLLFRANALV